MGYLLIDADVLRSKGLENFERMPDGRGIVDFSMLRVLGNVADAEIVSTTKEMTAKIEEEKASGLYDEVTVPNDGTDVPTDELPNTDTTEGDAADIPADAPVENPEQQPTEEPTEAPAEEQPDAPMEEAPKEEQPQPNETKEEITNEPLKEDKK